MPRGGSVGRISDDDVQRVRDATDLVSLVSETVVLKKKGRLFWGNCPFHGEKTPSFKIDPGTDLWHCFGCGLGGDAFGFVMRTENLDFPDAVRRLADRAHIEIVEEGGGGLPAGRKERLIAACEAATDFFHKNLTAGKSPGAQQAREYLKRRGFGIDVAKRWRLGFAPSGRDEMTRALLAQGFTREELVEANITLAVERGALKDRFFGRIMFPITDLSGRVIAFGGRVVGEGHPKYLNSNETPIFHKSSNMYGIDRARNEIVTSGTAVVVEGYTDVIALAEQGIGFVVATLGTALTERHVKLLGRFAKRVVYLFDGDEAGLRAANRAAEFIDATATPEAGSARVDLGVTVIPDGMDPADFVSAKGAEAMRALIDDAQPLLRFVIDQRISAHDLSRPEGKSAALADAVQPLAAVRGSILAQEYVSYIASRLLTTPEFVQRALAGVQVQRTRAEEPETAAASAPLVPPVIDDNQSRAERELLRTVTLAPSVRAEARELLSEEFVLDEGRRVLLGWILDAGEATKQALYDAIVARDRNVAESLSEWLVDAPDVEQIEYAFREISVRLKEFALERLILGKKAALRALDAARDQAEYDGLFREIVNLERQRNALRSRSMNPTDGRVE
ncbi:MAG: DNA primase [Actinobacteria bacterium HGW-Actinobacteria-1]|nr:MAG: DNA primase [Actinobacteria bacterium HGW-Actinobacteria-1]